MNAQPIFTYDYDIHARICPELAPAIDAVRGAVRELTLQWAGPVPDLNDGVHVVVVVRGGTRIPVRMEVRAVTWGDKGLNASVELTLPLGTTNCPTQQREALVRIVDALKKAGAA